MWNRSNSFSGALWYIAFYKSRYEGLSLNHRKIIDRNSGIELAKIAGKLWDDIELPARNLAIESGGEFFQLSGESLERIKLVGDKMTDDWIAAAMKMVLMEKSLLKRQNA